MNIALWVLQGILAAFFLMSGLTKAAQPRDKLVAKMPLAAELHIGTVRFIGTAEILGAVGLTLPAATRILPVLTPIAASALALVMVLAAITHARRRELPNIGINVVLFAFLVVVAWGRFGPYTY